MQFRVSEDVAKRVLGSAERAGEEEREDEVALVAGARREVVRNRSRASSTRVGRSAAAAAGNQASNQDRAWVSKSTASAVGTPAAAAADVRSCTVVANRLLLVRAASTPTAASLT